MTHEDPVVVPWPHGSDWQEELVAQAAQYLRAGQLVVFPTDTVYGLAAHPGVPGAVDRIFEVKQRPSDKRIALLVADIAAMDTMAARVPAGARRLAKAAWPGALTIVLECARPELGRTVALRWPNHPIPVAIIRAVGSPLATTSANLSGAPSPTTAQDVLDSIPRGYALLIDGGPCPGGVDSTVIDFSGDAPNLLRRGALDRRVIADALGEQATSALLGA